VRDTPTLKEFLRLKLPDYMIPSAFVWLDALPLTNNGKVDKRALPVPDGTRCESGAEFAPPRTPAERFVAGIWAQKLGLDQVGLSDNFFELGGHSLLAMQVVTRLCDVFQIEIPIRCLFERPTVEGLVEEIATIWGGRGIVDEIAETLGKLPPAVVSQSGKMTAR
jgi:acyl carrier protein